MRLRRLLPLAAAVMALALAAPVSAAVQIDIDKAAQRMTVTVDGEPIYVWPVSTGIASYDTPAGEFQPFRMERTHFSREWDDAPMPHSIFFTQEGHAIHGSYETKRLGQPASHGCVRLSPQHAATLYALVKEQGVKNTRVALSGEIPAAGVAVAKRNNGDERAYSRNYSAVDDDEFTGALPPPRSRGYREYYNGPRYYYRERPYYVRRNYAPRYYRYGGYPFGW
jgi:lipoprotein-anchoring transpeptidase ErfK/SrfK